MAGPRVARRTPVEWNPDAVLLEHAASVQILPGFESGAVSVQDGGAQLAAPLLDAAPGMRVLDACAAPGGKTLHIAQRTPGLAELIAVDDDPLRLQRVRDNLDRGGGDGSADRRGSARTAAVAGTGVLRPCAGGRAVFGQRRDPPAPGHQAAAPAGRHPGICRQPAARFFRRLSNYCGPADV